MIASKLLYVYCFCCGFTRVISEKNTPKVYFLFTSTPTRSHRLAKIMDIMDKQTLRPTRVILSIPHSYSRFENTYNVTSSHELLLVNYLASDAGPLSKYFGVSKVPQDDSVVVVGDDDVDYADTFVEDYLNAVVTSQDAHSVFVSQFDNGFGSLSPGLMAYAGVSCYAKQLRSFVHNFQRIRVPSPCYLADDVVATHYFKNVYKYDLRRVVLRKRNTDDHSVWRSKSSINAFHVANHNSINKKCEQVLTKSKRWHGIGYKTTR